MKYTPIVGGSDFDIALRRLRQVLKIEADKVSHPHKEHGFTARYGTGDDDRKRDRRLVRLWRTKGGKEFGIHLRPEGEHNPFDVAGLFVKGEDGKTYITHSGYFGSKKHGLFRKHTQDKGWIGVDGVDSERFLVTQIDDDVSDADILEKFASFVDKVTPVVADAEEHTDTETGKRDAGPARPAQSQPQVLNRIFYGPPGTGKTYRVAQYCVETCDRSGGRTDDQVRYRKLVDCGRIEFITFHQSYGYEEFVEGLRPAPSEDGQGGFRLKPTPGVLKRIADRARKDRESPYVLVIDEINRANVSKVMGELITLLEEDKREGEPHEIAVTLPHSGERFTLPANLHILGTMNTADRSIALIDTALRRRFDFEEMAPKPELLKVIGEINLRAVLEAINARLEYLIDRDHLIGHAWLMNVGTKAEVDRIMRRKIIPLIAEYFYDDWGKVRVVLGNTDDFVQRSELKRPPGLDGAETDERYRWTVPEKFPEGAYDRLV